MSVLATFKQRFSPKTAESSDKIVPGSAQYVVKLLSSKDFDETRFAGIIDPANADPALPDRMIGRQITFGDLKLRLENCDRPNGTVGVHYPAVYSLSMAQADNVITALEAAPTKGRSSYQPRRQQQQAAAAPAQTADSGLAGEVASLKADLSALIDLLPQVIAEATQSATPTEGHTKVAAPAEPVQTTGPVYRPGDVILVVIDGETVARQITADGKRLNKTIV